MKSELRKRLEELLDQAERENLKYAATCLQKAMVELETEEVEYVDTGSTKLGIICSTTDQEFVCFTLKVASVQHRHKCSRTRLN